MNAFRYTALAASREGNLFRRDGIDIDAATSAIEANIPVNQRENRVIASEADVFAGLKFRAALPHDDVAGDDHLAAEFFYAQPLADAVAAVLNAALSFFMSHDLRFFGFGTAGDAFDFHPGQFSAVTNGAVITFAASVFKRDDFFVFPLLNDFGRDLATIADLSAIDVHQHFKRGGFARLNIQKIDIDRVAFRDAILPSASLDDCVGHKLFSGEKKPRKVS
jgi:hypothetical protein